MCSPVTSKRSLAPNVSRLGRTVPRKKVSADFAKRIFPMACVAAGLPEPVEELRFAPPRRWRIDYAFPEQRVAVECEGGVWTRGRHSRGAGMVKDMEKYNELACRGWKLIRVTPAQLNAGQTFEWIRRAMEAA